ncbi:hypothetical protein BaRGS_00036871 [Batillaria attramentaria]|uniref:Cas12f1-like TNB domain-containing protein n=1 Tax=Batillaria attramentaria TaxID=370345 RepID=A0ABD0JAM4_9CAEN
MKPKQHDDINKIRPLQGVFGCQKQYAALTNTNAIRFLPRLFPKNQAEIKLTKPCKIQNIEHDFTVEKTLKGKFVLCVPVHDMSIMRKSKPSHGETTAMCGIDPGVRTFVTVYDPTNLETYQFGTVDEKRRRLMRFTERIDDWNGRNRAHLPKTSDEEKESWSRHAKKLWYKLKNQISSLHATVIAHLVKTYNFISLGKLDISSFQKGDTGKATNRWLRLYRHYSFREKLLNRAEGEERLRVEITDERYTSKTCSLCKRKNEKLGGKETFDCPHCGYSCHRDVNGARNILLKSLGIFC